MDKVTENLLAALKLDYQVKVILHNESQKYFRQAVENFHNRKSIAELIKESNFWMEGYLNEHQKPLSRFD